MKKSKPIWESSEGLKIFGNNHDIPLIYGYELSDKWKKEFDYYKGEELDYATFFKYKNWIYDLGEFMRISRTNSPFEECPIKFDGYVSETFFSGVLVKFTEDCDFIKVYHYYS